MNSADYHKHWAVDAETELRRIIAERDAEIRKLKAQLRKVRADLRELRGEGVTPIRKRGAA